MDVKELAAEAARDEEGVAIPIHARNGEPYGSSNGEAVTITVLGSESKRYREASDRLLRRALRSRQRTLTPKELRENRVERAAAAVIEWHGIEANGEPWPCEPENVKALLFQSEHILEQVEIGIDGHADFFSRAKPS